MGENLPDLANRNDNSFFFLTGSVIKADVPCPFFVQIRTCYKTSPISSNIF